MDQIGMSDGAKTKAQLLEEIDRLRDRLEEAEAALDAIRSGEVDALVVSSAQGDLVFTLQGADHPYRVMVETMNEGAATLLEDGSILYANPRLADILGVPLETLIGASFLDFIHPEDSQVFWRLIEQSFHRPTRVEINLQCRRKISVPVLVSFSPTQVEGAQALSLVAADLTEQKRSEEILAAERLTRSILDQAAEAILVCDTTGKIIRANRKAFQTFPSNLIQQSFEEAVPLIYTSPGGAGRPFSMPSVLAGESFHEIEAEYLPERGQKQFFLISAAPLLKDQEQIIGGVITLAEISERKRAEDALRESEQRFRSLFEANIIGVVFADSDSGAVSDANDEFLRIIGCRWEELEAGQINWDAIIPPEVLAREEKARLSLPPGVNSLSYEKEYLRPDGTRIPVIIGGSYLDEECRRVVAFVLDNSERKRMEERLAFQARVLSCIHEAVVAADEMMRVAYWNKGAEVVFGWTEAEALGKYTADLFQTIVPDSTREQAVQKLLETGYSEGEVRYRCKDGTYITALVSSSVLKGQHGNFKGLVTSVRDITRRKQAEEALQESEGRFRTMADGTPVIIWVTDTAGRIEFVNLAYREFFGVTLEAVQSGGWQPLVHPEDSARYIDIFMECLRDRKPFRAQGRVRQSDGEWRWVDSLGQPRLSETGEFLGMVGSSMDITERIALEERLVYQATILANVQDAVIATDDQMRITSWNPGAQKLFGYTQEEALGQFAGELLRSEFTAEQRDQALKALSDLGDYSLEVAQYTKDNRRVIIESNTIPLLDAQEKITGYVTASRDITERKRAEEVIRSYSDQLERSNKELQDFAFIASHDLQEPLRKIESFGNLLARCSNLAETERDYLQRMQDAADRMQNMIQGLLELSRVTTHKQPYAPVDLNEIAQTVVEDLETRLLQYNGRVEIHPLPTLEADSVHMHQLIQNLVGNALKYHRPDCTPIIQIGNRVSSPGWVEIYVQDNGIGFDMRYADQIFQPFQRLHGRSQYEGSGIGLAICKKIVERHGGWISVHSVPGEGSTFSVTLPIKQDRE